MTHQVSILAAPHRFKVCVCGRRFGKTALGLIATVMGHGPRRGIFRGAMDGARIAWVAPNFTITDGVIWPDLKKLALASGLPYREKNKVVHFPGGGLIRVLSADNRENLRGPGWDGMVIDEAADVDELAWTEELRPSLVDRQGWCIFIGTPKGFNWFHKLYDNVPLKEGWGRWQRPTSDNPLIRPEELVAARIDMGSKKFAQEHLAQFISIEGAWFDTEYFSDAIWFEDFPEAGHVHTTMAVDPSLGKAARVKGTTRQGDFSAIVWSRLYEVEPGQMVGNRWYPPKYRRYVDASIERRDHSQLVADVIRIADEVGPHAISFESNGFQVLMADELRRQSVGRGHPLPIFTTTNTTAKELRIQSLNPYLANGELLFRRDSRGARLLIDQLAAWPVDKFDDGPDCLEMDIRMSNHLLAGGGSEQPDRVCA